MLFCSCRSSLGTPRTSNVFCIFKIVRCETDRREVLENHIDFMTTDFSAILLCLTSIHLLHQYRYCPEVDSIRRFNKTDHCGFPLPESPMITKIFSLLLRHVHSSYTRNHVAPVSLKSPFSAGDHSSSKAACVFLPNIFLLNVFTSTFTKQILLFVCKFIFLF